MADRTLYDLLEVSRDASTEAIKAAYDRLSKKLDNSGDSPDLPVRQAALKEAFLTLGNPAKRAVYDRRLDTPPPVERSFWTLPKVAIVVMAVLAGVFGYQRYQGQQQQRIALEKEAALTKARQAEQQAKAEAEAERARQDLYRAQEAKYQKERDATFRQFTEEQRVREREARTAAERERIAQQRAQQQKVHEERQAVSAAQRQASAERAALCQMERQRYGRAISCP